jgi:cobalt-precorrin 5A hydrolase
MPDIITLSDMGATIARTLATRLSASRLHFHAAVENREGASPFSSTAAIVAELFAHTDGIVFVGPCGVMVRAMAPLLESKLTDPPVVVLDVRGRWVVSLLSGHEGGANALSLTIANHIGAEPVITTTSEAARTLIVGVGCRRGCASQAILDAVRFALDKVGAVPEEIRLLASADIKADEPGLKQAAIELGVALRLISSAEIRACTRDFTPTPLALKTVNLPAVAEPVALLAGRRTRLILPRINRNGVTVAIARENSLSSVSAPAAPPTEPPVPSRRSPKARSWSDIHGI